MENKKINFVYMNKKVKLPLDNIDNYEDFIYQIFINVTGIKNFKHPIPDFKKETFIERFNNYYYLTYITKIITKNNWDEIKDLIVDEDYIFVNLKLKGGVLKEIISGIFSFLRPILSPIYDVVETIVKAAMLVIELLELMFHVLEMIPIVFDPPRLINDILYAVTTSITTILDRAMNSIDIESPEDDDKEESGPMGVNKRIDKKVCLPPTMTQILFLMLCPPLAIFFKYDFMRAIIPSIICGVLCVKLYYFPGLLFAGLMTLC